jgi:hypothetical protein
VDSPGFTGREVESTPAKYGNDPNLGRQAPHFPPHFRHRRSLSDRRRSVFILGPHQAGRQTTASGPSTPIQPAEKQQARGSSPLASSQFPKESSRSWRSVTARELDDANPREPKHRGASGATRRDGSSVYTVVPKERERERHQFRLLTIVLRRLWSGHDQVDHLLARSRR